MESLVVCIVLILIVSFIVWLSEAATESGRATLLREDEYRRNYDYYQALAAEKNRREAAATLDEIAYRKAISEAPTPNAAKLGRVKNDSRGVDKLVIQDEVESRWETYTDKQKEYLWDTYFGLLKLQARGEYQGKTEADLFLLAEATLDKDDTV